MSKAIRIRDGELAQALEAGADYLIVGKRRFLLVEVDDVGDDMYEVTDPVEIELVLEAMQDTSPVLSGEEARAYLKARLKEHGIG